MQPTTPYSQLKSICHYTATRLLYRHRDSRLAYYVVEHSSTEHIAADHIKLYNIAVIRNNPYTKSAQANAKSHCRLLQRVCYGNSVHNSVCHTRTPCSLFIWPYKTFINHLVIVHHSSFIITNIVEKRQVAKYKRGM